MREVLIDAEVVAEDFRTRRAVAAEGRMSGIVVLQVEETDLFSIDVAWSFATRSVAMRGRDRRQCKSLVRVN